MFPEVLFLEKQPANVSCVEEKAFVFSTKDSGKCRITTAVTEIGVCF